jgi:hypothetical protein
MAEAGHRRAFEALVDHLVEREQAALGGALPVGEGDRRRIHADRHPRLRVAVRSVAARAIVRVERGTALQVGKLGRGERHRIGGEQGRGEIACDPLHLRRRRLAGHRRAQPVGARHQPRLGRAGRQRRHSLADRSGEFAHLAIFQIADDAPAGDGAAIIDRDVIEQPPAGLDAAVRRGGRRGDHKQAQQQRDDEMKTTGHRLAEFPRKPLGLA